MAAARWYNLGMRVLDVVEGKVRYRFEEAEEGGYTAMVPDLPGCISEGDTLDEALANIREALALYVEGSIEAGLELPDQFRALNLRAS